MLSNFDSTLNSNSVSASSSTQAAALNTGENKSSSSNTVFSEQIKKLAKQLGITPEEYQALMNDPKLNFASLTPEEQLKVIAETKKTVVAPTDENLVAENAEAETPVSEQAAATTATAPSMEQELNTQVATQDAKTQNVPTQASAPVENPSVHPEEQPSTAVAPETTSELETAEKPKQAEKTQEEKIADLKNQSGEYYDTKTFSEMKPSEMLKVYSEEYAKNKFLYADSENPKTLEDWDNLSSKEQKDLIKQAKKDVSKELNFSKNVLRKTGYTVKESNGQDNLLEARMMQLQAANYEGCSVEEFSKRSAIEQGASIANTLNVKKQLEPERLSTLEKATLQEADLGLKALQYSIAATDPETAKNMCYEDVVRYATTTDESKKVNLAVAEKEYLEENLKNGNIEEELNAQVASGAMTAKEKDEILSSYNKRLELLNSVEVEDLQNFGSKMGAQPAFETEILEDKKYSKLYANASSIKKAEIMASYLAEKYKNDPDKLAAYFKEAMECGRIEDAFAIHALAKNNDGLAERLAKSEDNDTAVATAGHMSNIGRHAKSFMNNTLAKIASKRTDKAAFLARSHTRALDSCDDSQAPVVTSVTSKSENKDVQTKTHQRVLNIDDSKIQREALDGLTVDHWNPEVRTNAALESYKLKSENQVSGLKKYAEGCAQAIESVAKDGTYSKFDVKNQLEGAKTTNDLIESEQSFSDDKKIELLNVAADHVADTDATNQADIHELYANSKYSEVQEHAASNIYKYDESAQADAIDITKNSGNTNAIDKAMANFDKYGESVQQDVKYQTMQKETEVRQQQEIAHQVADFHVQYEKLTGMKAAIDTQISNDDPKLSYVKAFLNATPQEQFKMLSKVPLSWQGTVFSKMVAYCPQMLSSLVKQGYGQHILNTPGLSSEVIYKVVNEMLVGQTSDKKAAAKYVKQHKTLFNENTLERVAEINAANDSQQASKYVSEPSSDTVKGALYPKISAIYENQEDILYNA